MIDYLAIVGHWPLVAAAPFRAPISSVRTITTTTCEVSFARYNVRQLERRREKIEGLERQRGKPRG